MVKARSHFGSNPNYRRRSPRLTDDGDLVPVGISSSSRNVCYTMEYSIFRKAELFGECLVLKYQTFNSAVGTRVVRFALRTSASFRSSVVFYTSAHACDIAAGGSVCHTSQGWRYRNLMVKPHLSRLVYKDHNPHGLSHE